MSLSAAIRSFTSVVYYCRLLPLTRPTRAYIQYVVPRVLNGLQSGPAQLPSLKDEVTNGAIMAGFVLRLLDCLILVKDVARKTVGWERDRC